jgi:hypothetical protein
MNGEEIQLLETDFALTVDEDSLKYLKKYNSFPAFLSALTLNLFENQTMI